ncbi:MAG TPA: HEPN domain-containing protein [Anaerolineae bacterium]|nr:HEPN domain-containing protein [Anaerolineae bacterium]
MQQAQYMLTVSHDNLQNGHYGTSVNRSYYALFYAASALLLSVGQSRKSHYGLMSAFRQQFIKTEKWPVEFSDLYGDLIEDREISDYAIFVLISQEDAQNNLENASRFVAQAEKWLRDREELP